MNPILSPDLTAISAEVVWVSAQSERAKAALTAVERTRKGDVVIVPLSQIGASESKLDSYRVARGLPKEITNWRRSGATGGHNDFSAGGLRKPSVSVRMVQDRVPCLQIRLQKILKDALLNFSPWLFHGYSMKIGQRNAERLECSNGTFNRRDNSAFVTICCEFGTPFNQDFAAPETGTEFLN